MKRRGRRGKKIENDERRKIKWEERDERLTHRMRKIDTEVKRKTGGEE